MKRIAIAVLLSSISVFGYSQLDLTVAPIGLLWGDFSVGGELNISENIGAEAGVGFGKRSGTTYDFTNLNFQGTGKYYFSPKQGTDGFYSGIFVRFIKRTYEYDEGAFYSDYVRQRIGGGFLAGYKIASQSGFIFDSNLGFGRSFSDKTEFSDPDDEGYTITWPELMIVGKVSVGYRIGNK